MYVCTADGGQFTPVLGIRIRSRIRRIHMSLGFLDPDPEPLFKGMDLAPDPDPSLFL
jgi:hypothetical protein